MTLPCRQAPVAVAALTGSGERRASVGWRWGWLAISAVVKGPSAIKCCHGWGDVVLASAFVDAAVDLDVDVVDAASGDVAI